MKEPNIEDYGFQYGGLEEESGWMLEGGEEAYYKDLAIYNELTSKKEENEK